MLLLLLAYVVVGLVIGIVVAATKGHAATTLAVLLLGLPNITWLALGVGIGGSWEGKAESPLRPAHAADPRRRPAGERRQRGPLDRRPVLTRRAGRARVVAAARRRRPGARRRLRGGRPLPGPDLARSTPCTGSSPSHSPCWSPRPSPWSRPASASRSSASATSPPSAEVLLRPHVWKMAGFALLWGLVLGFLGGLLASRVHRKGEAGPALPPERPGLPSLPPGRPVGSAADLAHRSRPSRLPRLTSARHGAALDSWTLRRLRLKESSDDNHGYVQPSAAVQDCRGDVRHPVGS
ncbi:hypothetical protein STANM309S_06653 [Streptomyces tanashiensis]